MERIEPVPVCAPGGAHGIELGRLADARRRRARRASPRTAARPCRAASSPRPAATGGRARMPPRARSPACRRRATPSGSRRPRRRPTPPNSWSMQPAQLPQPVGGVPAGAAADPADRRERLLRRDTGTWAIRESIDPRAGTRAGAAGPRAARVRPAGLRELPVLVAQRPLDRLAQRRAAGCRSRAAPRSSDHSVSLRTPSTSLRPTCAYSGVTSESQRLDSRGVSTGTGDHRAAAGRAAARTPASARRTSTTSAPPISYTRLPSGRQVERRQPGRRRRPRSRSAASRVRHPARRDHHRQPLDERAHHLEREAARADHDRRPELDRRRRRSPQDPADLLPAASRCSDSSPPRPSPPR